MYWRLGVQQATVSISHSSDYAIATAILLSADRGAENDR
jgi:phosphopantetheinyl transferase (holo-ACP synthase)